MGGWEQRRLLLDGSGRHLYVADAGEVANGKIELTRDTPSFELKDLRQLTRRSAPGRHLLSLVFEEGTLLLRFSYDDLRMAVVRTLASGRRVPIVDVPIDR